MRVRLLPSVTDSSSTGTKHSKGRPSRIRSESIVWVWSLQLERRLTAATDLSLEFLMGRALDNAMLNVGLKQAAKGASQRSHKRMVILTRHRWT